MLCLVIDETHWAMGNYLSCEVVRKLMVVEESLEKAMSTHEDGANF